MNVKPKHVAILLALIAAASFVSAFGLQTWRDDQEKRFGFTRNDANHVPISLPIPSTVSCTALSIDDKNVAVAGMLEETPGVYDSFFSVVNHDGSGAKDIKVSFGGMEVVVDIHLSQSSIYATGYVFDDPNVKGFVARLDMEGNIRWSKFFDEEPLVIFNSICVEGSAIAVAGAAGPSEASVRSFVVLLDTDGCIKWNYKRPSSEDPISVSWAVDIEGDTIAAGGQCGYDISDENGFVEVLHKNGSVIEERWVHHGPIFHVSMARNDLVYAATSNDVMRIVPGCKVGACWTNTVVVAHLASSILALGHVGDAFQACNSTEILSVSLDESRAGVIPISPSRPFVLGASIVAGDYNWLCLGTAVQNGTMSVVIYQTFITGSLVLLIPFLWGTVYFLGGILAIWLVTSALVFIGAKLSQARRGRTASLRDPDSPEGSLPVSTRRKEDKPPESRPTKAEAIEVADVQTSMPNHFKKSSASKKAAIASAAKPSTEQEQPRAVKTRPSSSPQPKNKSDHPLKITDTGTVVNRTVLKEYIERQRKAGTRELHYLKIKNDLNIVSQKKSSKLYRILQDLVDDEILVRKGSNYIIVG
ncbi:MAG: hypothetical protein Q6370_022660 [Candidatus Sigynarchaeota archaeon]